MNHKNNWAIMLLLTAIVPLTTGCPDPCKTSKEIRSSANKIEDKIAETESNGGLSDAYCAALYAQSDDLVSRFESAQRDSDFREWAQKHHVLGTFADARALGTALQRNVKLVCSQSGLRHRPRAGEDAGARTFNNEKFAKIEEFENAAPAYEQKLVVAACGQKEYDKLAAKRAPAPAAAAGSARTLDRQQAGGVPDTTPSAPGISGNNTPPGPPGEGMSDRHDAGKTDTTPATGQPGNGSSAGSASEQDPAPPKVRDGYAPL